MKRLLVALLVVCASATVFSSVAPASPAPVTTTRTSFAVAGQTATGWLLVPSRRNGTLLVYAHPCCRPVATSDVRFQRLQQIAAQTGAVVVAPDFRGPVGGFNVQNGVADVIAAAKRMRALYGTHRTVVWGASMGGEIAGLAAARAPGLFDYWVDTFGCVNLAEEYVYISGYPAVASAIARETGGTPITRRRAYRTRSPVFYAARLRTLRRVYIFHGVGDSYVPIDQSMQMANALRRVRQPVSLTMVSAQSDGIQSPYVVHSGNIPSPIAPAAHGDSVERVSAVTVVQLLRGHQPDGAKRFVVRQAY